MVSDVMPAPPVEPSIMILVPEGSSLTEREWKWPASTTGTCPSSGGTAYGSVTAATPPGRPGGGGGVRLVHGRARDGLRGVGGVPGRDDVREPASDPDLRIGRRGPVGAR